MPFVRRLFGGVAGRRKPDRLRGPSGQTTIGRDGDPAQAIFDVFTFDDAGNDTSDETISVAA